MFLGTFEHNLDDKGRFTLPAPFRETLKEATGSQTVFLTRGLDECLFGFDSKQFHRIVESFEAGAFAKKVTRKFEREFYGNCVQAECDSMGRLRIPEPLKKLGHLDKRIRVVGTVSRFEIWDAERWAARQAEDAADYEQMAEELF